MTAESGGSAVLLVLHAANGPCERRDPGSYPRSVVRSPGLSR